MRRAIAAQPSLVEAQLELGRLLRDRGAVDEARERYSRFLDAPPARLAREIPAVRAELAALPD